MDCHDRELNHNYVLSKEIKWDLCDKYVYKR